MSNVTDELTCVQDANQRLETGSGDATTSNLTWLGITLGLAASVAINLGQNLKADFEDRRWLTGQILFVGGAIVNFVAFAFAPASVLAPLEGAQFVTSFLYSFFFKRAALYDKAREEYKMKAVRQIGGGTALVVVGIALPVAFLPATVAIFDDTAIWCFWRGTTWWIYFSCTTVVFLATALMYRFARSGLNLKFDKDGVEQNYRNNKNHMLLYAIPAAILGSFSVIQAKAISELVEIALDGVWSIIWRSPLFFLCLLLIAVGLIPWFVLLNRAPKYFEPVAILPLMQGAYIVFSSLAGGIFFEEFDSFDTTHALFFAGGLTLIVIGLFFILPQSSDESGIYDERGLTNPVLPEDGKHLELGGSLADGSITTVKIVMGAFFMPVGIVVSVPAKKNGYEAVQTSMRAANRGNLPSLHLKTSA